jgi:hypothetical protein
VRARPIPPKLRAKILERDGYACSRCLRLLEGNYYSLHHRLPRGRGGKHTAANLVTVCGSGTSPGCHSWIETHRREATEQGWLVHSGMDPARIPIFRSGVWLQPSEGSWEPVEGDGGLMDAS